MKLQNLGGQPVDKCRVDTYDPGPCSRHIKVSNSPEAYVFSKEAWAGGGDGQIFVARELKTREPLAIKELRLKKPKRAKQGASVADWGAAAQQAVLEVQNAWYLGRTFGPVRAFTNQKGSKFYIVQKLMSGDARFLVDNLSLRTPRQSVVRFVALAVALDLLEVHRKQLIHFDIKPENICYNQSTMEVELLDLGISAQVGDEHGEAVANGSSVGYAPWQQMQFLPVDRSADIFALGATLAELAIERRLLGNDPVTHVNPRGLQDAVEGKNAHAARLYQQYMAELSSADSQLAELVGDMMHWSANLRPSTQAVIDRLRAMQPDAVAQQQIAATWRDLPPLSPAVRGALYRLDASIERIRQNNLRPVNSK